MCYLKHHGVALRSKVASAFNNSEPAAVRLSQDFFYVSVRAQQSFVKSARFCRAAEAIQGYTDSQTPLQTGMWLPSETFCVCAVYHIITIPVVSDDTAITAINKT